MRQSGAAKALPCSPAARLWSLMRQSGATKAPPCSPRVLLLRLVVESAQKCTSADKRLFSQGVLKSVNYRYCSSAAESRMLLNASLTPPPPKKKTPRDIGVAIELNYLSLPASPFKPAYLVIERAVELDENYLVRVLLERQPGLHLLMSAGIARGQPDGQKELDLDSDVKSLLLLLLLFTITNSRPRKLCRPVEMSQAKRDKVPQGQRPQTTREVHRHER